MGRPLVPRRRRRRSSSAVRGSWGLGALLVVLTGVNVYFFFFRADAAMQKLMPPVSTSQTLGDSKKQISSDAIPPSLLGASYKEKAKQKMAGAPGSPAGKSGTQASGGSDSEGNALEGQIGASESLSTV